MESGLKNVFRGKGDLYQSLLQITSIQHWTKSCLWTTLRHFWLLSDFTSRRKGEEKWKSILYCDRFIRFFENIGYWM